MTIARQAARNTKAQRPARMVDLTGKKVYEPQGKGQHLVFVTTDKKYGTWAK